jgi:hypothetical protein
MILKRDISPTNVSERLPKYPLQRLPLALNFRSQSLKSTIVSYNINEMLGTKMREGRRKDCTHVRNAGLLVEERQDRG